MNRAIKLSHLFLGLTAVFVFASAALSAEWPARPIELVVPLKAGGDTDFYARTYAKYLSKELGNAITIINVDGAGGTVGAQQVISSRPDGYKMLFYHTGNMYTNKLLGATDIDQNSFQLACIGVLDNTNVLVAAKDSGLIDAKDFLSKARANPGKLSVATTISGFSYFVLCKLSAAGELELNPVDFGGASAMVPAVLGGQVDLAANSYGVFKQYIQNKDILPLMVCSDKRNPSFPDVPTVVELGLPEAVATRAYFFAFPKGVDPKIVRKFSDAVKAVQSNPDYIREIKNAYCVEPFFVDMEGVQKYMDEMWADMVKYEDVLSN